MDYMSAVFGRTRLPLLEYKRFDKKVYAHIHTFISTSVDRIGLKIVILLWSQPFGRIKHTLGYPVRP